MATARYAVIFPLNAGLKEAIDFSVLLGDIVGYWYAF